MGPHLAEMPSSHGAEVVADWTTAAAPAG